MLVCMNFVKTPIFCSKNEHNFQRIHHIKPVSNSFAEKELYNCFVLVGNYQQQVSAVEKARSKTQGQPSWVQYQGYLRSPSYLSTVYWISPPKGRVSFTSVGFCVVTNHFVASSGLSVDKSVVKTMQLASESLAIYFSHSVNECHRIFRWFIEAWYLMFGYVTAESPKVRPPDARTNK